MFIGLTEKALNMMHAELMYYINEIQPTIVKYKTGKIQRTSIRLNKDTDSDDDD